MYVGAAYYPEHWPRERWEVDARLMQEAGLNCVRLAEFAWVFMEPEEGRFELDWLAEALAVLEAHGISAILSTPTAVMPAWVARKYPEALAMQANGRRRTWGVRKENCFTSGAYRLLSERITRAMAARFADAPNVIGWQTDNEFGHPVCYCATCRADFHDWVRARYGSLEELNRRWGTHFWGHRFGEWSEIPIPDDTSTHNPSLCLDWQRYVSHLNVRFQRDQVRILRELCPKHFVTHNFMGLFSDLDYYDLAADLDHVSWDNYPIWRKPDIPYNAAAAGDVMRGLKRANYWIMEQTAGPGGWGAFGRSPRPGEIRRVAFQQLAHGADHQLWFRWRTCTAGREQYWHGILGHDGKPLRRYREIAQTAKELHQLAPEIEGTTVKAEVAIIYDYDSIWALRFQPAFQGNSWHQALRRYYDALFRAGVSVDMVRPGQDLSGYRLVVAPELYVLPDGLARGIADYVAGGGVFLTDLRTGVKDETGLCHDRTLPGLLAEALGVAIEEYETLDEEMAYRVVGKAGLAGEYTAVGFADWVAPTTAEALAAYDQWHLRSFAAATRNRFGKGAGYYVGAVIKEPAFYDQLIAEVLKAAKIRPLLTPPSGVEVSVREGQGRRILFLLNHTEDKQSVAVPAGKLDLLTGGRTSGAIELGPHGVAAIKLD